MTTPTLHALEAAEAFIAEARRDLYDCHSKGTDGIPDDDLLGLKGLADIDEVLDKVRAALAAQPELPEPVTDSELEDLAHAANQEALSFGMSIDPFLKLAKTVKARCMAAPVEQDQPKREAMSEAEILQLMAEVQSRHAEDEDEKAGVIEFVRLVEARHSNGDKA